MWRALEACLSLTCRTLNLFGNGARNILEIWGLASPTISLKMEEHVSNTVDLINIFPALPSSLTFTPGVLTNVARGGMSKFNVLFIKVFLYTRGFQIFSAASFLCNEIS